MSGALDSDSFCNGSPDLLGMALLGELCSTERTVSPEAKREFGRLDRRTLSGLDAA
jgi:hypothetical protein